VAIQARQKILFSTTFLAVSLCLSFFSFVILLHTLSLALQTDYQFRYIYAADTYAWNFNAHSYNYIENLVLSPP
jgi:hypothetical protein